MPLYLREFLEKNNKKSNKLNVPSTLVDVASKIAEIRNTSYSEIAEITYNNACDFFDLELLSQMQRYIKINFKRRFPVQAFAWTLI